MTPQRWARVKEIFAATFEQPQEQRARLLDSFCEGDAALREEVERLLAANLEPSWSSPVPALLPAAHEFVPGDAVAQYRIAARLGEGGMGVVYRARDTTLQREVALKVLRPEYSADTRRRQRLLREARAASALNHPNIVTVYEISSCDAVEFIAMEYVDGRSLAHAIPAAGLPPAVALEYAIQIAGALAKAHAAGVIHRDLKPANIMITGEGQIKLVDFGLARQGSLPDAESGAVAVENEMAGTPDYMSPEQARGLNVDFRTDIFSLGVVLYEMLTGRRPFHGDTPAHTMLWIPEKKPLPLAHCAPGIPQGWQRIVAKALEKDRGKRYQTASQMRDDLQLLRDAPAAAPRAPRRRPVESVLAHPLPGRAPGQGIDEADPPSPVPAPSPAGRPTGRIKWRAAGGAMLTIAIATAIWLDRSRPTPASAPVSMAVLPFQSLVQSEPDEFLELGLADALITRLSNLRELVVRPTSAVRTYTDRKRDPVGIGKLLKVSYVVDGSVQQKAGRIRVSIQLIGVPDGRPLWAERYDEASGDIFAVQDAISTRVASSLRLQLAREETNSLLKQPASDPEAFRSYLRGVYFLERRTKDDLSKALDYFNDAIHRDPRFALAYAGAAKCYAPSIFLEFRQGGAAALAEMHHFVDRALELDPNMADAFVSQGALRSLEWDWTGAEQSYRQAIALNPNDVLARIWYGFFLDAMGREEENLAQRKRALDLDPLGWNANAGLGNALGALGRHDEAIRHLHAAVELNPTYFFTRQNLGKEYLAIGKPDFAIPEFQAAQDWPSLGYAYAQNGQKAEAQRVLEKMRQNPLTNSFDVAIVNAGLGRTAEALDRLEQAYRERTPWLMFIRVDLRLASLRGNPRFESVAAAMKIPRS